MANAPALPRRLPTISPRSRSSSASTVGWSGPGWPSPAAIGVPGCARPAPECSSWPSTRPSSAAWTCRPPARSAGSAWPPPRSPRRSRPTARPSVLTWLERARAISSRVTPLQPPEDESPPTCSPSSAGRPASSSARSSPGATARCSAEAPAGAGAGDPRPVLDGPGHRRGRREPRPWTCGGRSAKRRWWRSSCCMRRSTAWCSPSAAAGCAGSCSLAEVEELARRVGADLDALALDRIPDAVRAPAGLGAPVHPPTRRPAARPAQAAGRPGRAAAARPVGLADLGRSAQLPAAPAGDRAVGQRLAGGACPVRRGARPGGRDRRARAAPRRQRGGCGGRLLARAARR